MKSKTKEVLINTTYGGFGISTAAVYQLIKLGSPLVKRITLEEYTGSKTMEEYEKTNWGKLLKERIKNYRDGFLWDGFIETTLYRQEKDGNKYSWFVYSFDRDNSPATRENKELIKIVKRLREASFGQYSTLKVVKVPANVKYSIEEYDGNEHIAEIHKSWR